MTERDDSFRRAQRMYDAQMPQEDEIDCDHCAHLGQEGREYCGSCLDGSNFEQKKWPVTDNLFKVRQDTQQVTMALQRDILLLQKNQRNVARTLIALEKEKAELEQRLYMTEGGIARLTNELKLEQGKRVELEEELVALKGWVAGIGAQANKNSVQIHRCCMDKLPEVVLEGEGGKVVVKLEVLKD